MSALENVRFFAGKIIIAVIAVLALAGCGAGSQSRGPLDVKKVTYVAYNGELPQAEVYVLTPDYKVTQYSVETDTEGHYDYLAGELPSEDKYEMKEYEISESEWTNLVNILTRVNFMEIKEELPYSEGTCDAGSFYIQVETSEGIHKSGGYAAGIEKDSDNRRFEEARTTVCDILNNH
ncbi:MAG: hypothetical protein K6E28_06160 [Eubacterium sp.]|nr:hypothetical protein [Eubacterium sp.]